MLEIRFLLAGGGMAELVVATAGDRVTLQALDHTDALADLTAAVLRLAEGGDRAESTILDEHSEHLLTFERRGHDGVVLVILRAEAPRDLEPGTPERVVLSATCSFREVIQAMAACLDGIVRSHGISGYEAMWPAHPFPREARRRLLAHAAKRRRS